MNEKKIIVNFHVVNDPIWFEKVILFLRSKYTMVEMSFFENPINYNKSEGYCHITFDDGDKSFLEVAFPVLQKYAIPTTLFVSPKSIVLQENFWFQEIKGYNQQIFFKIISKEMSLPFDLVSSVSLESVLKCFKIDEIWKLINIYQKETNTFPKIFQNVNLQELIELDKSEFITVGAHTMNHPILINETSISCEYEIVNSIEELQLIIGHEVRYFAYPNGLPSIDFGKREMDILRSMKIRVALTTETKHLTDLDDRLSLPRIGISYGGIKFLKIKLILGEYWPKIKYLLKKSEVNKRAEILSLLRN